VSDYTLLFHIDRTKSPGHFFISIQNGDKIMEGPDGTPLVFGKYPNTGFDAIAGKGTIAFDRDRLKNPEISSYGIPLNQEELDRTISFLYAKRSKPDPYVAYRGNCVDFANAVLGIAKPDYINPPSGEKRDIRDLVLGDGYSALKDIAEHGGGAAAAVYAQFLYSELEDFVPKEIRDIPAKTRDKAKDIERRYWQIERGLRDKRSDLDDPGATPKNVLAKNDDQEIGATPTVLKSSDEPYDPVGNILLKDPKKWTEDEREAVLQSAAYQQRGHPRRDEALAKVRTSFDHTYGTQPAKLDQAGRMIHPEPSNGSLAKPAVAVDAAGGTMEAGYQRVNDQLAKKISAVGENQAVRSVQAGLNALMPKQIGNEGETSTKMWSDTLKVDGILGPKTRGALKEAVAVHGSPEVLKLLEDDEELAGAALS